MKVWIRQRLRITKKGILEHRIRGWKSVFDKWYIKIPSRRLRSVLRKRYITFSDYRDVKRYSWRIL